MTEKILKVLNPNRDVPPRPEGYSRKPFPVKGSLSPFFPPTPSLPIGCAAKKTWSGVAMRLAA
jgi:hypothetical protein